jgi:predicted metal-dependent hydrolase
MYRSVLVFVPICTEKGEAIMSEERVNRERPEIVVRKISFPFDAEIPRHWFGGNPVQTHVFNGLNLVFPDGERFFVRAVQDHMDEIRDAKLRQEVKAFFAQEGRHAHEHERYFATMRAQGYEIDAFLRRFHNFVKTTSRFLPAAFRLAVTAGAEHYTATLGAFALANPRMDEAHPTMRKLIRWHAVEEIEHKAVAFDVLRETHPSYALRIAGFLFATLVLLAWAAAGTRMLLRQDGVTAAERRAMLKALDKRDRGAMRKAIHKGFLAYLRRDFHPEQCDDRALLDRSIAELGSVPA